MLKKISEVVNSFMTMLSKKQRKTWLALRTMLRLNMKN